MTDVAAPGRARRLRDGRRGTSTRSAGCSRPWSSGRSSTGSRTSDTRPSPRSTSPSSTCARSRWTSSPALLASGAPQGVRLLLEDGSASGASRSRPAARRRPSPRCPRSSPSPAFLTRRGGAEVGARREGARARVPRPRASTWRASTFDTLLAGYLLDPAAADYPLRRLCERYLGTDVLGAVEDEAEGQLFGEAPWRATAAEAAAVALLAPVMEEQIDDAGAARAPRGRRAPARLACSPGWRPAGSRLDVAYLEEMGAGVRDRMATLKAEIYAEAGRGVQPQLAAAAAEDPLRPARPAAGEEDARRASCRPTRACSRSCATRTRSSTRSCSWRELDKLNSTYLEALPAARRPARRPGAHDVRPGGRRPRAGSRRRTRTCRTSRSAPSSGARSAGRSSRAGPDQVLLVPRLLADRAADPRAPLGRRGAARGVRQRARTSTPATAARVFDLPLDAVDPGSRSPGQDGELRPRVRDERLGARAATRHRARRGAGDHGRVLRVLPRDPASTSTARWVTRPSRASPRRSSAAAATSRSCRRRTPACATSGAARP